MKEPLSLQNKKFYIKTFGCQMNENESEQTAGILRSQGAQPCSHAEDSDIIIINTCAVREKPVEKLFSLLGRLQHIKKKNNACIGVTGCVAQLFKNEISQRNQSVDFVVGPDNLWKIPEIISSLSQSSSCIIHTPRNRQWREIEPIARKNHISGYVSVMKGCNHFCTYCVVPFAKGREKYRPLPYIKAEIKDLAEKGFKEIHLLGQNVNSYQDPESGKDFVSLLKEISPIKGIEWIRFITSHPKNFTSDIIKTMAETEKICHQLHLPIQSGSDAILRYMGRGYTRQQYLEKIGLLKENMPDISLSTDIIVGFPKETEKDFSETLSVLKQVQYTNIFSFRYSKRPHTAALKYTEEVPFEIKKQRLIQLQELQRRIQLKANQSLIGTQMKVLCMGKSTKNQNSYFGRNEGFQVVNFESASDVTGKFVTLEITDCGPYSLIGRT
ncbi:MAG: tRNA (N6-isopentenyl adenosine(37)-C2)-methylthiotransferase MiaB [Candidatus Aminicenantes bacterium]|nr:tRNA (N6-isopentenyl adenosine(37)-C2)-methylthiotransferase MiaB [Candidatus Aminicenantes bacterium]